MADFSVRADSVNVEQIMEQIRARIREKRGVDYTEEQIREMATVRLEKFLDPRGVRSDLLERFRGTRPADDPAERPNYAFEDQTLYDSHRGLLRLVRKLLRPVLKLFFNPNPLVQALHIQARLNTINAQTETTRRAADELYYEVMHNLVVELTRMAIEVKNLKMRVESLTGRLEFNERRARALEGVVAYRTPEPPGPDRPAPRPESGPREAAAAGPAESEGPGQRSRRRRRRRGRRSGVPAETVMAGSQPSADAEAQDASSAGAGPETGPATGRPADRPDAGGEQAGGDPDEP
jgi:hypothetical protein